MRIGKLNLGDRIYMYRRVKKLTQSEFALLAGVSQKVVSDIERGVSPGSKKNIMKIKKIL